MLEETSSPESRYMHKKRVPYSSAAESTMKNTTIHFIHHIIPLHTTNTGREREREGEREGEGERERGRGRLVKEGQEERQGGECLGALPADTTCQLDVFGHDGDTFGVDGAQVGVLKQTHQVGLAGLLQGGGTGMSVEQQ